MGKAIKIDNVNFASRGLGQVHWCKYDISYCTLYKYLIGDSNSYIDLGIKCSKYNIKKVKATIMTDSTTWRFIIGNTRYISSSSQSQDAIRINNTSAGYGLSALFSSVTSNASSDLVQAQQPLLGKEQYIELHTNAGDATDGYSIVKYSINGSMIYNFNSSSSAKSMNDDYNLFIMGGYNNTNFFACDNGVYVSRIYFEDANNQADPNNPNGDIVTGMPLDLVPCQLNRDIDGSLAFDGKSHSAGECGFVNFFNGKFYGSTTGTLGFTVTNY
jgi:hypothetical protein